MKYPTQHIPPFVKHVANVEAFALAHKMTLNGDVAKSDNVSGYFDGKKVGTFTKLKAGWSWYKLLSKEAEEALLRNPKQLSILGGLKIDNPTSESTMRIAISNLSQVTASVRSDSIQISKVVRFALGTPVMEALDRLDHGSIEAARRLATWAQKQLDTNPDDTGLLTKVCQKIIANPGTIAKQLAYSMMTSTLTQSKTFNKDLLLTEWFRLTEKETAVVASDTSESSGYVPQEWGADHVGYYAELERLFGETLDQQPVVAAAKFDLKAFVNGSRRNAEFEENGFSIYAWIGNRHVYSEQLGVGKNTKVFNLSKITRPGQEDNIDHNPDYKSSGKFKELIDRIEKMRPRDCEGIYVESVMSGFLGSVLERYGFYKVDEQNMTDNYYRPFKSRSHSSVEVSIRKA